LVDSCHQKLELAAARSSSGDAAQDVQVACDVWHVMHNV
jgi:hypothetical protein